MIQQKKHTDLYIFLSIIAICTVIGFIFIYSSSSAFALEKYGSAHYFVKKQFIGCFLGLIGLIICRSIPLNYIKALTPLVFIACLGMTALTMFHRFSPSINGSHRWLKIGSFMFQPSELLKMALIAYLSYILAKKQHRIGSLTQGYLALLCIIGVTGAVLLKQPDFGQTVTLSVTAFMLLFIAQCNIVHLVSTIAGLIPVAGLLIFLKPYRFKRILTFLNPWLDPQDSGYQIIQSLIAIGSGHIWGVGIARSKQKFFYLPMQCTDFIFSIIAEETGLVGASCLILLYLGFLYFGIKIALKLTDLFSFYLTLGFVLLTSLQAVINIFVATGLIPTKGLGLPFISYGNSALLCNLCMIGVIINAVSSQKKQKGVF